MVVEVFNIDWCVEEEDIEDGVMPNLPSEVTLTINRGEEKTICDILTNMYGWLINSCSYEIVQEEM